MSSTESHPETELTTEVTFGLTDHQYPFVGLSALESCRVTLQRILPRLNEFVEYFSVSGADPDAVLSHMEKYPEAEARMISRFSDGGEFEFLVTDECPVLALTDLGAIPRAVTSVDGNGDRR